MSCGDDLARRLRDGTRDHHGRIDSHPVLRVLVESGLDRPAYARALLALYPPHAKLEAHVLAGLARCGLQYGFQPRAGALAGDLIALGVELPDVDAAPERDRLSSAGLVGMLYVLEGSRLGGAVIHRNVFRVLGTEVPRAFFASAHQRGAWRDFWRFAAAACAQHEISVAVDAAREAFRRFERQLDAVPDAMIVPGRSRTFPPP